MLGSGTDGLSWLLTSTLSLIVIVCLVPVAHHVRVSSSNSGQLLSSLPGKAMWQSFLRSGRKEPSSVEDAVLATVQVSPSFRR